MLHFDAIPMLLWDSVFRLFHKIIHQIQLLISILFWILATRKALANLINDIFVKRSLHNLLDFLYIKSFIQSFIYRFWNNFSNFFLLLVISITKTVNSFHILVIISFRMIFILLAVNQTKRLFVSFIFLLFPLSLLISKQVLTLKFFFYLFLYFHNFFVR